MEIGSLTRQLAGALSQRDRCPCKEKRLGHAEKMPGARAHRERTLWGGNKRVSLCIPGRGPQERPAQTTPLPRTCSLQERGWENGKVCVEAAHPHCFVIAVLAD